MCGIVGSAGAAPVGADTLIAMRDALRHRGPDDAGAWWSSDGHVGFGHRRLAIIDLSPAGRQPMADARGELHITFNGEIYNYVELRQTLIALGHVFQTATDTEVILEAYREWGTGALARLNGMFAFALYDARAGRVLLARDPAGEKPLYYRAHRQTLTFASEVKALLADPTCPRELDPDALDTYLAFGYALGDQSLLRGIRRVKPGHAIEFDVRSGAFRSEAYWTLPAFGTGNEDEQTLLDEYERLLEDSVRLRLVADVPVGVLLSGGVDSSLVVAMAARVTSGRVRTFNISFPGHGEFDEAPHARAVAQHFGTEHIEFAAQPADVSLLPDLARQFDDPIADSSMLPTFLVSRLIREQATVAIGGDGGDELFGGYFQHSWVQQQARAGGWLPRPLRRVGRTVVRRSIPVGTKGRNYLLGLMAEPPYNIVQFNVIFDEDARRRLLGPLGYTPTRGQGPEDRKAALTAGRETPLRQSTALDFLAYLPDDILVKVDRASMLCSLEVRAPFLDTRLIDLAFRRLPDSLRATASARKLLSRRLAERVLPAGFDATRKQGFSLPLPQWFKGDWGRFVEDVLTSKAADWFDRKTVAQLIRGQRAGMANTHRLFALTMIELWRREYGITVASEAVETR